MIGSMVSLTERIVLRQWVANNWKGAGDIVEIGSFGGGSAVSILQGMTDSARLGMLHCYDTFQFPKNDLEGVYRKLLPMEKGDGFRRAFELSVKPWAHRVIVEEGDASKAQWHGFKIEFMHIDCSISREFHEAIAMEFYPHLLPGCAIAHQDYGYGRAPFIAEIMAKLEGVYFDQLHRVETTMYYGVRRQIPREDLERIFGVERVAA